MLALYENEIQANRRVTIRFEKKIQTYYCFYHRTDDLHSHLILSYDLNKNQWNVDTMEFKTTFEKAINDLFKSERIPFEEQLRYVINYLDTYFHDLSQSEKMTLNLGLPRSYSLPWFRRLRDIRRWSSQDVLTEQPALLQRYSAPEKPSEAKIDEQILSVKGLSRSFHADNDCRYRTKTFASSLEYPNESNQTRILSKAPAISEIWLNVCVEGMDGSKENIEKYTSEEKLKKLAEKFVTYFGGTFQCNIGQNYQLEYDGRMWNFIVHKYEFCTHKTDQNTKAPKSKIIFLIHDIPHYVRG
ncbi:unnamed protein product [Adineta ricciae]|uniref:Uncharacterized protein n=1 Tax=Adineta ricciae TaxID=249248 RepID=A0A815GAA2_ADIRI|nr:unnamed protein product [Adineta ricciae]CAF1336838.1 unnamed protein product [Adineta ricciae]